MFRKIVEEIRLNKKISQIFWLFLTLMVMLIILIITWTASSGFEKGESGFKLLSGGIYFLFVNDASRASRAFIISGAILAFFPMVLIFPIFYFKLTNYLINFKIKKYFPHALNFSRWSKMIHLIILILIFFIIGTIITISNGGSLKPTVSFKVILWTFDIYDIQRHRAGIGMLMVYVGALLPSIILLFWCLSLSLSVCFEKLGKYRESKKIEKNKKNEKNDII
ncbi:hypothetical protein [Spiroplasma endosymbiont of Panorpa germanica]|uniref:hypothetical protein n=1 Tax=Spiroplasma endosymbiont of Panorpa germanica TaxID=3066314 RepID=UPI0030D11DCC